MNSKRKTSFLSHALRAPIFILLTALVHLPNLQAAPPTFWTGAPLDYTQSPVASGQDVLVPGFVSLDRGINNRLYNGVTETGHLAPSPVDTEWATATPGVIADLTTATTLTYSTFDNWVGIHFGPGTVSSFIINKPAVLHLVNENIYIAITFKAWGTSFTGGFEYLRSTPGSVAPPTPSVTITNPANGAVFAALANLKIGATASVSSGTVTNVSFFNGPSLLGSAGSAPFSITASDLTSGSYALQAVATAAGVSSTSAVVNVSVVTPVVVSNSTPAISSNQFSFTYTANPGLTYVVQSSPDLMSWSSRVTNVPQSSPVSFSDTFNVGTNQFYRVGRVPNP